MRLIIIVLVLVGGGILMAWHFGVFNVSHWGDKIAGHTSPIENVSEQAGSGLPSTASQQRPVMQQPELSKKDEPKITLMYSFHNRLVPSGLGGSVDLPTNSIIKEVAVSDKDVTIEQWRAMDLAPLRRRIFLEVVELTKRGDIGFSLPELANSLVTVLTTNNFSQSTGQSVTSTSLPTSILPIGIAQTALPAINAFLSQTKTAVNADDKIATGVWLTNGEDSMFNDYSEQASTQVTSTTNYVSSGVTTRQLGFTLTLKPYVSPDGITLHYSISNSVPSSSDTASGVSLSGEAFLSNVPIVLLDSVRDSVEHSRANLLGIPMGFENIRLHKCDLLILRQWPSTRGENDAKIDLDESKHVFTGTPKTNKRKNNESSHASY